MLEYDLPLICQIIGVKRDTYKDYELGRRATPLQVLRDLEKFYKVSADYFFEDMSKLSMRNE